jgi:hypothetical protein
MGRRTRGTRRIALSLKEIGESICLRRIIFLHPVIDTVCCFIATASGHQFDCTLLNAGSYSVLCRVISNDGLNLACTASYLYFI